MSFLELRNMLLLPENDRWGHCFDGLVVAYTREKENDIKSNIEGMNYGKKRN